jgi:hypothetical protein
MRLGWLAAPALIGMLLFAGYSVYEKGQYDNLVGQYYSLSTEYTKATSTIHNQSATIGFLRAQLNSSAEMYHNLLENYTKTNIMFQSPLSNQSIGIWGLSQDAAPHGYIVWELLDTFDNHISLSTNTTANVMILGIFQFVKFVNDEPYTVVFNSTGTQFHYDEPVSEGCAGYVLVVRNLTNQTMEITPDVTATYEYTPFLTGYCSL